MSIPASSASILFPPEIGPDDPVGGKARGLGRLEQEGFSVPNWFVVLPAFEPPNQAAIDIALTRLHADATIRFAVRSSALEEDGEVHSFAGQFETFLEVPPDALRERILQVRQSAHSARAQAYRNFHGLKSSDGIAVVVQVMVPAVASGVAFSAHPITGQRRVVLINAVAGLGDRLVSGETNAEVWQIDRQGLILERPESHPAVLDDAHAQELASLTRRIAARFGRPQDIEWARDDTRLFLLQTRPITSLTGSPDPDDDLRVWDNSNIVESYSGVTSPLTFSFARRIYEHVYRQFCRLMKVPKKRINAEGRTFESMLGHLQGHVYYNLGAWYRVLALLPGFSLNRGFMEQMMGVKEPLPERIVEQIIDENRRPKWREWIDLAGTLGGLAVNALGLARQRKRFMQRLEQALEPPPIALDEMTLEELAAYYRHLEDQLLKRWDAPLTNDFFAMIAFGLTQKAASALKLGDHVLAGWLSHSGGVISAEPALRIQAMAASVRENPALQAFLKSSGARGGLGRHERFPEFARQWDDYLETFGGRCLEELKLETPSLTDDPAPLLANILALAEAEIQTRSSHSSPDDADAENSLKASLRNPLKRWGFRRLLEYTRRRVRDRENLRFERTRLFGRVRQIVVEMGKRLAASDHLAEARDVFYLDLGELLGFAESTSTSTDLQVLAAHRKERFRQFEDQPSPPGRIETHGPVGNHGVFTPEHEPSEKWETGDQRQGIGCCAGKVTGKARVVLNPREARLEPGEVLVAKHTDPGWVMLFPAAKGILVERGSVLSHSAIVARELGIPAVVAVPGLCRWLQTGDTVTLDGATGLVLKHTDAP